jgi:hypothetical protein
MKHILLYFLLAVSLVVFAQPQPDSGEEVVTQTEQLADPEPESANEKTEKPLEADPGNNDFKPSEEISEDFPVSLPSDI